VLRTLTLCPMHGWGIGQRIRQVSGGELEVNQGSLYPALQRLEQRGLIESEWASSENNRRARYYRLTATGRAAAGAEVENWRRFAAAVEVVLRNT
jgi:PadR family transcriptional regulator, regulatory protein PadR